MTLNERVAKYLKKDPNRVKAGVWAFKKMLKECELQEALTIIEKVIKTAWLEDDPKRWEGFRSYIQGNGYKASQVRDYWAELVEHYVTVKENPSKYDSLYGSVTWASNTTVATNQVYYVDGHTFTRITTTT